MVLALGCSGTPGPQAEAPGFGMDEQLLAALPLLNQGAVLKACADEKSEVLSFSFLAEKPDPANHNKTLPADPMPTEEQLTAILRLVDERHTLKVRSEREADGRSHLVFTIHRDGNALKGSGQSIAADAGSPS